MTMDVNKEELVQMLKKSHVREARNVVSTIEYTQLSDLLIDIAFDNNDMIQIYFLVLEMLGKRDEIEIHRLAMDLLANPLCVIPGAYFGAVYHAKKMIELEPFEIKHKEQLLYFHIFPDRLLSNKEIETLVNEVLAVNPNSKIAKDAQNRKSIMKNVEFN